MYKGVKRALDVTFSLIGTAVSSPILLAVAAAVKLDSKGPVIFKQERLGKDGKVFEAGEIKIWKCRNCGHIVVGTKAPEICPICAHPKAYFEIKAENY